MKSGNYELACAKLEESLRLDHGIGTEFNLADCNEKRGRLATAWSGFLSVAAAARAQNQEQRENVASTRAAALERRLPKLVIDVPGAAPSGLEVKRDGIVVGSESWGSAVPVDPGTHRVTAAAQHKETWEGVVSATEGSVVRITVPADLTDVAVASPKPVETRAPVTVRNEPRPEQASFPEPIIEQRGVKQRVAGYVVSGLGIVGLGIGAGFAIDSIQKRNHSKDHCTGDLCNARGVSLRDKAIQSGDVATVAGIAGGAVLLGGIILVLTAPRDEPRKEAPPQAVRVVPHVALNGGGIAIHGVLP
jgi:hypothetical protein